VSTEQTKLSQGHLPKTHFVKEEDKYQPQANDNCQLDSTVTGKHQNDFCSKGGISLIRKKMHEQL